MSRRYAPVAANRETDEEPQARPIHPSARLLASRESNSDGARICGKPPVEAPHWISEVGGLVRSAVAAGGLLVSGVSVTPFRSPPANCGPLESRAPGESQPG